VEADRTVGAAEEGGGGVEGVEAGAVGFWWLRGVDKLGLDE